MAGLDGGRSDPQLEFNSISMICLSAHAGSQQVKQADPLTRYPAGRRRRVQMELSETLSIGEKVFRDFEWVRVMVLPYHSAYGPGASGSRDLYQQPLTSMQWAALRSSRVLLQDVDATLMTWVAAM